MLELFGIFLLSLLVITAVGVVRSSNLFAAVMLSGIFSLLMAGSFFLLDAADVALTEAAVGAGISTVLLLGALALTTDREKRQPAAGRSGWALLVVAATAAVIIYATLDKPRLGDPEAPVHQHLVDFYFEQTREQIGIPNVVTAILGSFRGYDTFGETIVVFTAAIGVLLLLGRPRAECGSAEPEDGLRHHLIPQVVGRLVIPFILLFGLYVQFHGEYGPGGGFQAGALVAAGIILFALLDGRRAALRALPGPLLAAMASAGVLIYGGIGVACMLLGGGFLDYSVLAHDPVLGQQVGILVIEAGVGITVTGVLVSIFHAFAARQA